MTKTNQKHRTELSEPEKKKIKINLVPQITISGSRKSKNIEAHKAQL